MLLLQVELLTVFASASNRKRRFAIQVTDLFILGVIFLNGSGCHQMRGVGQYLLGGTGRTPGTNSVFLVDTQHATNKLLCNETGRAPFRCAFARTALDYKKLMVLADPAKINGVALYAQNHELPTRFENICNDCQPIDLSVDQSGSIVTAVFRSGALHSSSIWTLSPKQELWQQRTPWLETPKWYTRAITDEAGDLLYLAVTRGDTGIISTLWKKESQSQTERLLFEGRNVATFSVSPSGDIAAWTNAGIEIDDSKTGNRSLIPTSGLLSSQETIRPDGMVFAQGMLAIAVCDRVSGRGRILENNLSGMAWRTVFEMQLGRYASLQAVKF